MQKYKQQFRLYALIFAMISLSSGSLYEDRKDILETIDSSKNSIQYALATYSLDFSDKKIAEAINRILRIDIWPIKFTTMIKMLIDKSILDEKKYEALDGGKISSLLDESIKKVLLACQKNVKEKNLAEIFKDVSEKIILEDQTKIVNDLVKKYEEVGSINEIQYEEKKTLLNRFKLKIYGPYSQMNPKTGSLEFQETVVPCGQELKKLFEKYFNENKNLVKNLNLAIDFMNDPLTALEKIVKYMIVSNENKKEILAKFPRAELASIRMVIELWLSDPKAHVPAKNLANSLRDDLKSIVYENSLNLFDPEKEKDAIVKSSKFFTGMLNKILEIIDGRKEEIDSTFLKNSNKLRMNFPVGSFLASYYDKIYMENYQDKLNLNNQPEEIKGRLSSEQIHSFNKYSIVNILSWNQNLDIITDKDKVSVNSDIDSLINLTENEVNSLRLFLDYFDQDGLINLFDQTDFFVFLRNEFFIFMAKNPEVILTKESISQTIDQLLLNAKPKNDFEIRRRFFLGIDNYIRSGRTTSEPIKFYMLLDDPDYLLRKYTTWFSANCYNFFLNELLVQEQQKLENTEEQEETLEEISKLEELLQKNVLNSDEREDIVTKYEDNIMAKFSAEKEGLI